MLHTTIQQLGDASVLCCRGGIVAGEPCAILRAAAMGQRHARLLVLDVAEVDRIDAGGLGVLLGLREWARANSISFKLMNVMHRVEEVLELTALDRVFEYCSVPESLCLLHRATVMAPWPTEESNPARTNGGRECVEKRQQLLESPQQRHRAAG